MKAYPIIVLGFFFEIAINSCAGIPRYTHNKQNATSVIQSSCTPNKRLSCQQNNNETSTSNEVSKSIAGPYKKSGLASFYGDNFHGRKTASGEIYDRTRFTAAHRTICFGTMVKVTNNNNGRSVIVRINDRGPHIRERIIDLSYSAAEKIDCIKKGVVPVTIEIVEPQP